MIQFILKNCTESKMTSYTRIMTINWTKITVTRKQHFGLKIRQKLDEKYTKYDDEILK